MLGGREGRRGHLSRALKGEDNFAWKGSRSRRGEEARLVWEQALTGKRLHRNQAGEAAWRPRCHREELGTPGNGNFSRVLMWPYNMAVF